MVSSGILALFESKLSNRLTVSFLIFAAPATTYSEELAVSNKPLVLLLIVKSVLVAVSNKPFVTLKWSIESWNSNASYKLV